MTKKIDKVLANLVMNVAVNSGKKASLWGCYQPQEPAKLANVQKKF